MRTQSMDTPPEIERIWIAGIRKLSPARKFAQIVSLADTLGRSGAAYRAGPEHRINVQYGAIWARRFIHYRAKHPHLPVYKLDLPGALLSVINELERRRIPYAAGGLLACNLYGLPATIDTIELVVDEPRHIRLTPSHTRWGYRYLDVTHLYLTELRHSPEMIQQARPLDFLPNHAPLPVLTPEAVVIDLLRRYTATGRRDDALYNAILGLVKVQAPTLDIRAVRRAPDIAEVLPLLLDDAGIAA